MNFAFLVFFLFRLFDSVQPTILRVSDAGQDTVRFGNQSVTLTRWNGEARLGLSYAGPGKFVSYVADDPTPTVEVGIVLDSDPHVSHFNFSLSGCDQCIFAPQLPLNEEMNRTDCTPTDCDNRHRPENVVDSIAVYHKTKANHRIGALNYATGKLWHIYRTQAVDRNGFRSWGRMNVDHSVLTLTFPPDFLAKASYPVFIDPTLGYTTIGGSPIDLNPNFVTAAGDSGTSGYAMTENGTAVDVQWYVNSTNVGNASVTFGIYSQGSSVPGARFAQATAVTVAHTGIAWYSAAVTGSLVNGSTYYPADDSDSTLTYAYDALTNGWKFVASTYSAGTLPDPFPGSPSSSSNRVSAYIDYTASGASASPLSALGAGE